MCRSGVYGYIVTWLEVRMQVKSLDLDRLRKPKEGDQDRSKET